MNCAERELKTVLIIKLRNTLLREVFPFFLFEQSFRLAIQLETKGEMKGIKFHARKLQDKIEI